MPRKKKPAIGSVNWFDLTVKDAPEVRDFYAKVVGWKPAAFAMGGYEDFCMNTPVDGKTVAGICHARGENAKLPPQWLIYITVKNLATSVKQCRALGGKVLVHPREAGGGRIAVIRDPAGAVAAPKRGRAAVPRGPIFSENERSDVLVPPRASIASLAGD